MTSYIYNMVDTWNDGATTFTAVKMNVTDTASNAASLLMDLQVGGASKFRVAKSGDVTLGTASILMDAVGGSITAGGTYSSNAAIGFRFQADLFLRRRGAANLALGAADAAAPVAQTLSVQSVVAGTTNTAGANLTITGSQGTGTGAGGSIIFQVAPAGGTGTAQNALSTALTIGSDRSITMANTATVASTFFAAGNYIAAGGYNSGGYGTETAGVSSSKVYTNSAGIIGFMATASGGTGNPTLDTILARDAANTLALRNDTAGQEFRVYDTYTSGSNYRRLTLGNGGGAGVIVSVNGAGAGNTGSLYLRANTSGGTLEFGTASTDRWRMDASGHLLAIADNTYDIGAVTTTRPRNIFAAGYIRAAGANGFWAGSTSFMFWDARTQMSAPASNVLRVDDPSSNAAIIQTRQFTVSNLPSAATYPGSMAFVSDATATTARSTVAGGGSNKVMVMSDGTNWLIVA